MALTQLVMALAVNQPRGLPVARSRQVMALLAC
jgi:hypothetical protein